jgi:hypothetical protein
MVNVEYWRVILLDVPLESKYVTALTSPVLGLAVKVIWRLSVS